MPQRLHAGNLLTIGTQTGLGQKALGAADGDGGAGGAPVAVAAAELAD